MFCHMYLHILLFSICFVMLGGFLRAAPEMQIESPVYDFGVIRKDGEYNAVFVLKNSGDSELTIGDIKAGCGCTIPKLTKKEIAPGESVEMDVVFRSAGWTGRQRKIIKLFSNDPSARETELALLADIRRDIEISRQSIVLVGSVAGPLPQRTINLTGRSDGRPYRIINVDGSDVPFAEVEWKAVTPGRDYQIEISTAKEAMRPGALREGRLVVTTDHPDFASIELKIGLHITSEIMTVPATIRLSDNGDGIAIPFYLYVRSVNRSPIIVEEVRIPGGEGRVEITPLRSGQAKIEVSNVPLDSVANGAHLLVNVRDSKDRLHESRVRLLGGRM